MDRHRHLYFQIVVLILKLMMMCGKRHFRVLRFHQNAKALL